MILKQEEWSVECFKERGIFCDFGVVFTKKTVL